MKLYDSLIRELQLLIDFEKTNNYSYDKNNAWPESEDYELILQKDTAYELGGKGFHSADCVLVTTNEDVVNFVSQDRNDSSSETNVGGRINRQGNQSDSSYDAKDMGLVDSSENQSDSQGRLKDEIIVWGQDLQEISEDVSYARIAIITVNNSSKDNDTEKLYQLITDIDFVKYHVFTKGYMFRNSSHTNREQVRVSKNELNKGMTFEQIGNTIISHYKMNPEVLSVKLIFVTAKDADYEKFSVMAKKATEIRRSLSMINKNMPTECGTCGIRDICNEVEGLKELHFGKKGKKNKQQIII